MELTLTRHTWSPGFTLGTLCLCAADLPPLFVVEDVDRRLEERAGDKVKGDSAIPLGRYRVVRTLSQRFGRVLPLLLDVPGFAGIRVHPGNSAADTEGCLLPGLSMNKKAGTVGSSRLACKRLDELLSLCEAAGDQVWITVRRRA